MTGFVTIGSIIVVGMLLAHLKILDTNSQLVLSRLAFFVASPALMITVLSRTDVSAIFSANLVASIGSVVVAAGLYILVARLVFKRNAPDTVIGTFSSAYVNAGNLGLPIAGYVLGDASLIAPMLLTQLILLQPLGLTVLDITIAREHQSWARILSRPLRNPLMLGSVLGLLLSIFHVQLPPAVHDPLALVGGMAIPAMLIAYGISLRLGPRPGRGEPKIQVGYIVLLKLVIQPLAAFLLARYALGLDPAGVLAVTVIAALPTAQNVFVHANRYQTGIILARDAVFVSTILSVPVLVVIAALLA
nr:AEC family transporter [Microlunatus panaciterrae]